MMIKYIIVSILSVVVLLATANSVYAKNCGAGPHPANCFPSTQHVVAPAKTVGASDYIWDETASFIPILKDVINTKILGEGSKYRQFTDILFLFAAAIYFILTVGKWILGKAQLPDLLGRIFYLLIIIAFYITYTEWLGILFDGSYGIGDTIQESALGSDDVLAPPRFIMDCLRSIRITGGEDTAWLPGLSEIAKALYVGLLLVLSFIVMAFTMVILLFATLFPIILFSLLKILGLMIFSAVLFDSTERIFNSWLQIIIGTLMFTLVARIAVILMAVLMGAYLDVDFDTYLNGKTLAPVDYSFDNIGALLLVFVLEIFCFIVLFRSEEIASRIVGGFGIRASGMAASLAQSGTASLKNGAQRMGSAAAKWAQAR